MDEELNGWMENGSMVDACMYGWMPTCMNGCMEIRFTKESFVKEPRHFSKYNIPILSRHPCLSLAMYNVYPLSVTSSETLPKSSQKINHLKIIVIQQG